MASLPEPVIAALEAFAAPHRRDVVQSVATDDPGASHDALAALTESVDWVDMGAAHPLGPDRSDPEGIRRLLQAMGAEGRCSVLSASGAEDDRDLGGALDGVLHQAGGALVVCRPGPLAFLVTSTREHWLLSDRDVPQLTGPIPVVR
ncbi:hypothetical protein EDF38_3039 [Frigoribacterium sp. PhB160]|uniref:hypothetical protein n=1 Tax=Frigoribacterium sp. PhB160 TaxID=2485192 RepID=UPI000F466E1A|nr:hypothetical protein [Frigoribacterium sp. PhB160]ROS58296.1 hypothetical protein EDF38_3039 [Frigoribacterium sp. PhB160]